MAALIVPGRLCAVRRRRPFVGGAFSAGAGRSGLGGLSGLATAATPGGRRRSGAGQRGEGDLQLGRVGL